jgi:hypothetical protein
MSDFDDGGKAWPFGNKSRADRTEQFKGDELVYLSAPYSHADDAVCERRFWEISWVAAQLMRKGIKVFSPISHTHPIAQAGGLPGDWNFWREYDLSMLRRCKRMVVLMAEGWKKSKGLQAEIKFAGEMGIPVDYFKGEEWD